MMLEKWDTNSPGFMASLHTLIGGIIFIESKSCDAEFDSAISDGAALTCTYVASRFLLKKLQ